ncbi:MAG: hypothetical protein JW855_05335 [Gammaproteobacteria bacterium]|nr:hypothetical protein [Gammaproteobacteria bacterium]
MIDSIFGQASTRHVFVNGAYLSPNTSSQLLKTKQKNFGWGYTNPGTDVLALAILLEFTDKKNALRLYRAFEQELITNMIPYKNFELSVTDVLRWLNNHV